MMMPNMIFWLKTEKRYLWINLVCKHMHFVIFSISMYIVFCKIAFYDEKRQTILSENCSVVLDTGSGDNHRYDPCEKHRQTLNRMLYCALHEQGRDQDRTAVDSHTFYHCLTSDEMWRGCTNSFYVLEGKVEKLKEHTTTKICAHLNFNNTLQINWVYFIVLFLW